MHTFSKRFLEPLALTLLVAAGCAGLDARPAEEQRATEPTSADSLVAWSARAERTIVTRMGRPGSAAAIDFAIVQTAVYEAVNAIDGGHRPYALALAPRPGAAIDAAVATAAYRTLLGLFVAPHPVLNDTQRAELTAEYDAALAAIPDGEAKEAGVAVGGEAAAGMLALRAADGRDGNVPYVFGSGAGAWTLPVPGSPAVAPQTPWVAKVQPFTMTGPRQFELPAPPALDSDRFATDLAEVRTMGAAQGSARSPEQTEIADFWKEHAMAQYNRNWRSLVRAAGLDAVDGARLLAMTNVASADALIACLDGKYRYGLWRPVQAVRAAGDDPTWLPLLATPNHPEYPSAHSCLTEAVTETMEAFFGTDKVAWTMDAASGRRRSYARFKDISDEVMEARIWAGLHYRFSMEAGRHLGRKVAQQLVKENFQRIAR